MGLLEPIVIPAPCSDHIGELWPRQAASSDDSSSAGVSFGLTGTSTSIGAFVTGGGTSSNVNTGTSSSSSTSDSSGSSSITSLTTSSSSVSTSSSSSDSSSTTSVGGGGSSSSSSSSSGSSSSFSNTGTTLDLVSSSSSSSSSLTASSTSPSPTPTSTSSSSITSSGSSTDTITSAPASFASSASSVSLTTIFTTERNGSVISTVVPVLVSQAPSTLSTSRKGMIAGGAIGGSLLILVIAVLVSLFCWRRRKNRKLGFLDALVRKSKEGKGAGGVGLLDGEFEDDEEYRDEMQMRGMIISSHSQQSSLSDPQHSSNYPYNTAPTLYRAHASNSGSFFREEGVWPPPGDGFVDPFVPARELETNSDLHGIVEQVMGPASSSLPPGAAPSTAPGTTGRDVMGHGKQTSGSSSISTPKISSPLALTAGDRTSLVDSIAGSTIFSGSPPPGASAQPKNWLERQPKTPSPRNATFALPALGSNGGSVAAAPPSAFANSASSLAHTYGTPTNTQRHSQRVSWGDLPTPSRPGSRQGSASTIGAGDT